jgi:hypothetical protein
MISLALPPLLNELIAAGRWPRTSAEAMRQNLAPLVSVARIQALAPEESDLYLEAPPFMTVRAVLADGSWWNDRTADPGNIDVDRTIIIGDFGMGTDAPIVLDYRLDDVNPRVLRLRWSIGAQNRWVIMAPDFATLVAALGL